MTESRMVISPATGTPPVAAFWFEERRTVTPWWAYPVKGWWTRWRRLTRPEAMFVKDGSIAGTVVPFADAAELQVMRQYLAEL